MLYYGFWELSLVPMAILIAMYGRKDGPKAALKFFLFTFIPSAPLLVAILWLYAQTGSFDLHMLRRHCAGIDSRRTAVLVFSGLPLRLCGQGSGFPAARVAHGHIQRSACGSGDGRRRQAGAYSMLRFHIGLFPAQARIVAPVLVGLAVIGILYGACLALVQRDFWRLMAFAALSHLSMITLGIYGLTQTGWEGGVYQILNHGVVDGALFLRGVPRSVTAQAKSAPTVELRVSCPARRRFLSSPRWP